MATSTKGLPDVPLRGKLSAKYTTSFAYPTIKDRCPIILCKIIDQLYRERINIGRVYGIEAQEGLKTIIEQLSKLRYEMQTNKVILPLEDSQENTKVWNEYLEREKAGGNGTSWFTATWMWVECYMYRRIQETFTQVSPLRDFDFFKDLKEQGFRESLLSMEQLGGWFLQHMRISQNDESSRNETDAKDLFHLLLQISLWGNKCDLSISAGSQQSASGNTISQLNTLKQRILVDETCIAWQSIGQSNQIIDIVMDNAGYELFTDLCLADFLISFNSAIKLRFRVKNQPWFVSDTTKSDFFWTLNNLSADPESRPSLAALGARWRSYLDRGVWTVDADSFWTYPHVYSEMREADPQLYACLAKAQLVIFKGDLNYRKLVGDLNWETTVSFPNALQGFSPTNILSLRTLKADVVTGLTEGQAETTSLSDENWMVNGTWGVIQFAPANVSSNHSSTTNCQYEINMKQ